MDNNRRKYTDVVDKNRKQYYYIIVICADRAVISFYP